MLLVEDLRKRLLGRYTQGPGAAHDYTQVRGGRNVK